jgi:SAM-dependent methyltransferase
METPEQHGLTRPPGQRPDGGGSGPAIPTAAANAEAVRRLYDEQLTAGEIVRQMVFPHVFGQDQYVAQYSDNSAQEIRNLAKRARVTADSHVIDVGCGGAGPTILIAREFGCRITGVDLSERHLAAARERVREAGLEERIRLIEGDIYQVAPGLEKADVVMGTGAWCHLNPREFFPLCRHLLQPGGRISFMERVKLGPIEGELWRDLTTGWASPAVETFATYYRALSGAGFGNMFIDDLTPGFLDLQRRFVEARQVFREQIIALAGQEFFDADLKGVEAECRATEEKLLGYGIFIATAPA